MQQLNDLTFDDQVTTDASAEPPPASITEQVWRFIRDNPNCSSGEATRGCNNDKGVSTRINQLRQRGYIETDFLASPNTHTVAKTYTGVTKEERTAMMLAARAEWEKKQAAKKSASKQQTPRKVEARTMSVIDLNNVSIVEARKLYDELKKIFGG